MCYESLLFVDMLVREANADSCICGISARKKGFPHEANQC